jgi:nucleotide-binding universal stress UspA family protein
MNDMPTILSCTDGSVYAASVYDHSAWAARRMVASVHVLHMLDPHRERAAIADFSGNLGPDEREALMTELVEFEESKARVAQTRGRAILQAAHKHLLHAGVNHVTTEQRHGSLVEMVEKSRADMIVIGKRGEAADFARLHLGANLERVIRTSHQPVLVASRAFFPIERCLIAFDASPSAKKAVTYACQQPLLKGLEVSLLTVGKGGASLEGELEKARRELADAGYQATAELLPGEPEKVIPEVLEKKNIQLLIMGAYGNSRIRHLIVGSTTTTMVRTCKAPVLMFR